MKSLEDQWLRRCRRFAQEVIEPQHRRFDQENRFPDSIHQAARVQQIINQDFPVAFGGGGIRDSVLVQGAEILASSCAPSAFTLGFNRGALHPILVAGTLEQQEYFIGNCIKENRYAALCLTESKISGSNLMGVDTIARKTDQGWVISGTKSMVGNGSIASYFIVLAKVEENHRSRGLSFFVVPRGAGVEVGPNTDKLGFRAVETPAVVFREVLIPSNHLIGAIGSGTGVMLETLNAIRLGGSAVICGLVRGALCDVLPWVEEREVYGGRLMHKSHIQLLLGDIYGRLLSVRQEVQRAAELREKGQEYGIAASLAKLHAAELALDATSKIVQIFGWRGIDNEYPIQKRYRDARQTSIFEGTSEVQRANLFHQLWKVWRESNDV